MQKISTAAYADSKPHYKVLDGLRGVAALMVVWFHIFEGYATSPFDQKFNHGYLAVDFFFILSGFVVGYAYDDRWGVKMGRWDFFKRRLIRLQPMIVLGVVFGVISFLFQGSVQWDGTAVSFSMVILAMVLSMFLIPAMPGSDIEIRGNGEMFPLNGPSWSLFFEYIGNILYALFIRRLPTFALRVLVVFMGIGLASLALFNISGYGNLGFGWSLGGYGLLGGSMRLLFSFSMGLLMARNFKPIKIRGAFWICSAAVIALLSVPYVGSENNMLFNGIYDAFCIIVLFPAIVYLGASGNIADKTTSKACNFLGDISYPLYIVQYPVMYYFYYWLWSNELDFSQTWWMTLLVFFGCIALAYASLKLYDEPLRKWLTKKFISKK